MLIFDDLMSEAIQRQSFPAFLLKAVIEMLASYSYSKTCSPSENSTQISVGMHSTWLSFAALDTENKSVLLPNACLIRIASDSCPPITKKRISRIITGIVLWITDQTHREISSCRVYPSINKSMKTADEKVETINAQAATLCEAKRPPHSPRPKTFDLVWSETTWPAVKNFMQRCTLSQSSYRSVWCCHNVHECSQYLQSYIFTVSCAYENYWPVQIRHYSNGKTNFIYIHEDEPSVKAFLAENRASES